VNAEDPEGCVYAAYLAVELRHRFGCDVFIDLNCYRKYGHNESDEPAFTQPLEYQLIRKKKPIREIYRDDLIHQGVLEKAMAESLEEEFKQALGEALDRAREPLEKKNKGKKPDSPLLREPIFKEVETGVSADVIREVADAACRIPDDLTIHKKLRKLVEDRLAMVRKEDPKPIDWGMAETLAYGTLLWNNISVRLAGQDSGRGTFSHRHGLWLDQKEGSSYFPLQHLKEEQGRFDLINSLLSEYAALGFEYGYSIANTKALVLWEAQFGDFCNGAQVMIDQFITTSEQKWGLNSSLVMLLPHGYEGQGPEHSSARIERFLTLSGSHNIQVCNPTSPAQLFHLLRRQAIRSLKKPLIVFTPKGLLRHPECISTVEDLSEGIFREILEEPKPDYDAKRLIFCSGRVYYDLIAEREKQNGRKTAIVRIEQLYPLHEEMLDEIIKKYGKASEFIWVQEEPNNMGAWSYIAPLLQNILPRGSDLKYVGRERSASPAAGSHALHKKQYEELFSQLFGKAKPSIFEIAGQSKS
jgi:2-oxoglutarate dehydrogenase E1 component